MPPSVTGESPEYASRSVSDLSCHTTRPAHGPDVSAAMFTPPELPTVNEPPVM